MKNVVLSVALLCGLFTCAPASNATSITYSFTGSGPIAGTNFTYIDLTGFLAFDTGILTPTTSTDLFFLGADTGRLTGFDFVSATTFNLYAGPTPFGTTFTIPYQISALTTGESLTAGNLVISNTLPATVTPEPSSLLLLSTGALALADRLRRRFLRA